LWHLIEFSFVDYFLSPNEKFAITFSGYSEREEEPQKIDPKKKEEMKKDDVKKVDNIFIWNIMRTEIVRSFHIDKSESHLNFKFSHDSKYLGRVKGAYLMIYEAPEMNMLPDKNGEKIPIKADGIYNIEWSKTQNILVCFTKDITNNNKVKESVIHFYEVLSFLTIDPF
jgi:uncharacterized protein with WD repeat